jgi:predicted dehydrogenase
MKNLISANKNDAPTKTNNIALIGLGPHAHRLYLKFIEKYREIKSIKPVVLIDLHSQENKVKRYLRDVNFKFDEIIFLDDKELNREYFSPETEKIISKTLIRHAIKYIIVSTEPKSHKKYCLWALKNNLNILFDKPLTSPVRSSITEKGAKKIKEDYLEILKAKKQSSGKIIVQCQRRYHKGYKFLVKYLQDFIEEFHTPITYIDIFHGDGCWVLPNEFYERENHPYKYGYGKLMHSGYHFVDLLAWLIRTNEKIVDYDRMEIFAKPLKPSDLNYQLNSRILKNLFGKKALKSIYKDYNLTKLKSFGELDSYSKLMFYEKNNLVTSCNLDLLQNSFSRRAWSYLPRDTYKGNGRVRHERVNIEVGPFLNIQVHSYQAYEPRHPEKIRGMGNEDHFEIFIYRNTKLVGGKSLERFDFGRTDRLNNKNDKYYLGHNEKARDVAFLDFLDKNDKGSPFEYQDLTIELLSQLSLSLSKSYENKNPLIKFGFSLSKYVG